MYDSINSLSMRARRPAKLWALARFRSYAPTCGTLRTKLPSASRRTSPIQDISSSGNHRETQETADIQLILVVQQRRLKVSRPKEFQRLGPQDGPHASRPSKITKLNHAVLLPEHLSEVRSRSQQSLERCQCGAQVHGKQP